MARVGESIRERIVSGDLAPGEALNQSSLAREHNVSRIPVREALGVLAGEGLLRIENGTGYVTPLSIAELQEIYEIREALEPLATRIGLANVGRAEIMVMERQMEEMIQMAEAMAAAKNFATWLHANATFHRQVYAQSNRRRMVETIDRLTRETDRYLWLYLKNSWDLATVEEEHSRILEAVRARDADELESATLDHLRNAHETILQYMLSSTSTRS
jgi:DNA-binding GntR family transcriptional regulator